MPIGRFHNLLRDRVHQAITEYSATIICGQVKDFAEYREACGYIRGLNDALRLCEDIEGDLNK